MGIITRIETVHRIVYAMVNPYDVKQFGIWVPIAIISIEGI